MFHTTFSIPLFTFVYTMTAPKRPAPKRPAPKCPRAQTAAPKRRRPNGGAQKSRTPSLSSVTCGFRPALLSVYEASLSIWMDVLFHMLGRQLNSVVEQPVGKNSTGVFMS